MDLHHYLFSFTETEGAVQRSAAVTLGLKKPRVTVNSISKARVGAGVSADAVLWSVSYLGQMSMEEFRSADE